MATRHRGDRKCVSSKPKVARSNVSLYFISPGKRFNKPVTCPRQRRLPDLGVRACAINAEPCLVSHYLRDVGSTIGRPPPNRGSCSRTGPGEGRRARRMSSFRCRLSYRCPVDWAEKRLYNDICFSYSLTAACLLPNSQT